MCNFLSAVITKDQILFDYWDDSHENLIQKHHLDDRSINPQFVRVELLNKNDDIYDQNVDNWDLKIDQDYIPDWFDKDKSEIKMRKILKKVHHKVFLINININELTINIRYCKNSTVNVMRRNSTVNVMRGNSTVNEMWENSTVNEMLGNSTVNEMLENSTVNVMRRNSTVKIYSKYSQIKSQKDNSIIVNLSDNNQQIILADKNWNIKYK